MSGEMKVDRYENALRRVAVMCTMARPHNEILTVAVGALNNARERRVTRDRRHGGILLAHPNRRIATERRLP